MGIGYGKKDTGVGNMQHFFVPPEQVKEDEIHILGTDVNHIRNVLRMKIGEQLKISDGNNRNYLCEIARLDKEEILCHVLESELPDTELSSRLVLFQGLPKSDKMELIIQKAVELGAAEIVPVATRRTIVRMDEKKAAKKVQRWNSIAESACKQSGRSRIPVVSKVVNFEEALNYARQLDHRLIPYELADNMEDTRKILSSIEKGQSVGIFIGPEGGFEREEVEQAMTYGTKPVTLGRRILRTETAGLAMLSVLMFQLEE
jgi:16S rRNA (uracil1498-N3)-methyltransferase